MLDKAPEELHCTLMGEAACEHYPRITPGTTTNFIFSLPIFRDSIECVELTITWGVNDGDSVLQTGVFPPTDLSVVDEAPLFSFLGLELSQEETAAFELASMIHLCLRVKTVDNKVLVMNPIHVGINDVYHSRNIL